MTDAQAKESFEKICRENGLGFLIDFVGPGIGFQQFELQMSQIARDYQKKFAGADAAPSLPKQLDKWFALDEYAANPHKTRAFFQAYASYCSPEMLIMVWRVLLGASIKSVELNYNDGGQITSFSLSISIVAPQCQNLESYSSTKIADASVLRHLGIMEIDNKPIFDGFYALNLGR